ncbi:MAG TPA: response regulator [Mycobacteriales bacterium]|nr:response regulator [Mycobacteriales bacterium]
MSGAAGSAKILLVDDRPENLLALEAILSGLGHELVKAASGEEALKRLLAEDVAVILLDVQMPGMDGFETASHIKQRERTRDIPILFLTAIDGAAHQAFRGYAAGAVDYLAKPFDPWVLRAKVAVFVELHERRRQLEAQTERLKEEAALLRSGRLQELSAATVAKLHALRDALPEELPAGAARAVEEAVAAAEVLQQALPERSVAR